MKVGIDLHVVFMDLDLLTAILPNTVLPPRMQSEGNPAKCLHRLMLTLSVKTEDPEESELLRPNT
jgi:hypothetical protein